MVNYVRCCESLSSCICQFPDVKVQCGINCGNSFSNVTDTFHEFFHGIFVKERMIDQFTKITYNCQTLAFFLWYAEWRWVLLGIGSFNNSQFKPFIQWLLNKNLACFWNFKLFSVYQISVFRVYFVGETFCKAQVIFVCADSSFLVFEKVSFLFIVFFGDFRFWYFW